MLAGLSIPFIVEHPDGLRDLLRALAEQLAAAAGVDTRHIDEPATDDQAADPDPIDAP